MHLGTSHTICPGTASHTIYPGMASHLTFQADGLTMCQAVSAIIYRPVASLRRASRMKGPKEGRCMEARKAASPGAEIHMCLLQEAPRMVR